MTHNGLMGAKPQNAKFRKILKFTPSENLINAQKDLRKILLILLIVKPYQLP